MLNVLFINALLFVNTILFGPRNSGSVRTPTFVNNVNNVVTIVIVIPFVFINFSIVPRTTRRVSLAHPGVNGFLVVSVVITIV